MRRSLKGGEIVAVVPGSLEGELGLKPGDVLLSINGYPLRDVIDYRFYGAEEVLTLLVERDGRRYRLSGERDYGQGLGLEFREPVFDGLRLCRNRCPFCFVAQLPAGLRSSLYLRDDDYRYSFLTGSFVTLTNLSEEDWRRIGEQHLSPLYVSIHASDVAVRRALLGNARAPDIISQLRRLGEMGIQVHGQIVIVPGLNDGSVLWQTVEDMAALFPVVQTLALVPVGLTRYRRGELRPVSGEEAREIVAEALGRAAEYRSAFGHTWLYPADELFLLAGEPIPDASFYDDMPQLENGVGLVRSLLDDWAASRKQARRLRTTARCITLACGESIAPLLQELAAKLERLSGLQVQVIPVRNGLFGDSVTVSGLLTGGDVISALEGHSLGDRLYLPSAMFDRSGTGTLDDLTLADIAERLGVPVYLAGTLSEVLDTLASEPYARRVR